MPSSRGGPPGRPAAAVDFAMWWLPEFAVSGALVCAGLTVWWPLAVVAIVPMLRPAGEAAQLHAERQHRDGLAATGLTVNRNRPPIVAAAERLDRPEPREITP